MPKPILCLDFDGVIHSYMSGWKGADTIPDPIVPGFFAFLLEAQSHFDVQIFSSRSHQPGGIVAMLDYLYKEATNCLIHEADFDLPRVIDALDDIKWPTQKPPAMLTIDDRALTFTGNWPAVEQLLSFKPWNKS